MGDIAMRVDIELQTMRCYTCGWWFGWERGQDSGCPSCTRKQYTSAAAEVRERDKTIAALRGALTKAKKRGKR